MIALRPRPHARSSACAARRLPDVSADETGCLPHASEQAIEARIALPQAMGRSSLATRHWTGRDLLPPHVLQMPCEILG